MYLRKPITEYTLPEACEDDLLRLHDDEFGYSYITRQQSEDIQSIKNMHNEYRDLKFCPDDVWLDLGACIGAFGVPASNGCKQVICVEPSLANISFLRGNLCNNCEDGSKYAVLPFAVTALNDYEIDFYLQTGKNTQYHTCIKTKQHERKTVKVKNVNFDLLIELCGSNCVKMDIEGAELQVIFSSYNLKYLDEFYMEYHKHLLGETKKEQERIFDTVLELLRSKFDTVEYHGKSQPTFHCSNR